MHVWRLGKGVTWATGRVFNRLVTYASGTPVDDRLGRRSSFLFFCVWSQRTRPQDYRIDIRTFRIGHSRPIRTTSWTAGAYRVRSSRVVRLSNSQYDNVEQSCRIGQKEPQRPTSLSEASKPRGPSFRKQARRQTVWRERSGSTFTLGG